MEMLHVATPKMSIKSVNFIVIKKWKELRKLWESVEGYALGEYENILEYEVRFFRSLKRRKE